MELAGPAATDPKLRQGRRYELLVEAVTPLALELSLAVQAESLRKRDKSRTQTAEAAQG